MTLSIQAVAKRFGPVTALHNVSLEIATGSFVCFLGPSGCGKTTLLRIVAGLEAATEGRVVLNGQDMEGVPTRNRQFGMVFQSYSLFPNMTARRNVGYGLECRGRAKAEIAARADAMLRMVHLADQAEKLPAQLSGGQQQRVALARALAIDPSLLLLDEPLSALDAKVREELQVEIRALQRRLGVTTIMVTHDQEEALAMADTIVVLNDGRVEQVGAPVELYARPATPFVAGFIGRMNMVPSRFAGRALRAGAGAGTLLGIRPEEVVLCGIDEPGENRLSGTVRESVYLGARTRVAVAPDGAPEDRVIHVDAPGSAAIAPPGSRVGLHLPAEALRVLQ